MNTASTTREPSVGRAHQPALPSDDLAAWADPLLLARKGRLVLLCTGPLETQACVDLYRRYYTDSCFDTLPSLRAALAAVYAEHPEMRQRLLLLVILKGLDVLALGSAEAALLLVRDEETRALLGDRSETPYARPVHGLGVPLWAVQRRLGIDDSLVLTTRQAAKRLSARVLRRVLSSRVATDHAAMQISRAAGKVEGAHEPVTVIRIPGFSPVPEFVGFTPPVVPPPPKPKRQGSSALSPVWVALLVALVAVAAVVVIEKPTISWRVWENLALQALTPEAQRQTATAEASETRVALAHVTPEAPGASGAPGESVSPTPTTTPSATRTRPPAGAVVPSPTPRPVVVLSPTARNYPVPQLLSPREGQDIHEEIVTLRWSWPGTLGEDEYFDVRMWREGSAKAGIAWTKNLEYQQRDAQDGWYHWTVVVVRGQNGVIERELSREPQAFSFRLIGSAKETPQPTLVRPTRVNP